MISVQEALQLVLNNTKSSKTKIELHNALQKVLAVDIRAKIDSPPFHQSAMDGYALLYTDYTAGNVVVLDETKENQAGGYSVKKLKQQQAIRIFTGAKIPDDCNLVVPQEMVELNGNSLVFTNTDLKPNANIRPAKSQFAKGDVLIKAGTLLNSVHLSVIATAGHSLIEVYQSPSVGVLITGNELVPVGTKLKTDSIVESNSILLKGMLNEMGIANVKLVYAKDNLKSIASKIGTLLNSCDVVIATGGISVGKYDYLKQALEQNKVKEVFYKIKQKPGKPMFFGMKGKKMVFSLPGNPASALTCFLYYVKPALHKISGIEIVQQAVSVVELESGYDKKAGMTHFLKGKITNDKVTILPDQESYKITSFMEANCLIVIPEENSKLEAGAKVHCYRY